MVVLSRILDLRNLKKTTAQLNSVQLFGVSPNPTPTTQSVKILQGDGGIERAFFETGE